jgi:hypothetical protein
MVSNHVAKKKFNKFVGKLYFIDKATQSMRLTRSFTSVERFSSFSANYDFTVDEKK